MSAADEQLRLESELREYVRGMSAAEFDQFVTETRPPDEPRPGDAGRAAAARRHGGQGGRSGPGAAGRAALERRHPNAKDSRR